MSHVCVPRNADARLIGVELPRMNVEHRGNAVHIVLAKGALDEPEGKVAEIGAAMTCATL